MADIGQVLSRIRALGADVVLERGKMTIVSGNVLRPEQRDWVAQNREDIETHLRSLKLLLPIAENDTPPQTWGQFARLLYSECPEGKDPYAWSYFVTEMGKVVREHFGVGA